MEALFAKEVFGGGELEGRGEEVSLAEVAGEFGETALLYGGFDAFGDDFEFEFAADGEDEANDVGGPTVDGHVADERAIDFDFVDGEAAQPTERGLAGAEVAEAEAHAEVLEAREDFGGELWVGHTDGLGDFELESEGIEAALLQCGADILDESRVCELLAGDVDGDGEARKSGEGRMPGLELAAGVAKDPIAERENKARVFGDVDELVGRDEAEAGRLPADESLETSDVPGGQIEDGLVEEAKSVLAEGGAEFLFKLEALLGAGVEEFVENFATGAAEILSAAHGDVGVLQQDFRVSLLRGTEGDADAGGEREFAILRRQRGGNNDHDVTGETQGIGGIVQALEQDGEFVATEASHRGVGEARWSLGVVVGVQAGVEAQADLVQDLVADNGADRIVDFLEAVNIDEEHGAGLSWVALGAGEAGLESLEEEAAVGQAGEGIVEQVVLELLLGADALGNVAVDDDQLVDLALGAADGAGGGLEDEPGPVAMADAVLELFANAGAASLARGFEDAKAVVGVDLLEGGGFAEVGGRVAEDAFVGGAVVEAASLGVDQGNHVGGVFGDDAE